MKNIEAVNAYVSLRDLNQHKFNDGKVAMKIFELFTKLQPSYDFRVQEERKIQEAHPKFNPVTGRMKMIDDGTDQESLIQELKQVEEEFEKLSELEVDVDFEPFEIDLTKEQLPISGQDIGNLKPFITFKVSDDKCMNVK